MKTTGDSRVWWPPLSIQIVESFSPALNSFEIQVKSCDKTTDTVLGLKAPENRMLVTPDGVSYKSIGENMVTHLNYDISFNVYKPAPYTE